MKKLLLLPLLMLLGLSAGAQAVASFTAVYAPQGNNLLRWNFSNTSTYCTGGTFGWNMGTINYGDGTSSILPTGGGVYGHNYSLPGTYTVGLRIRRIDSLTGSQFCTDSTTQVITVGYSACATSFTVTSGNNGLRTFTATTPGATSATTYSWSYGDGGIGSGSPATHTYTSNGNYTVTLTATGGGCTYSSSQPINVQGVNNTLPLNCANLHATFTTSIPGNASQMAYFTNTSSTVSSPYTLSCTWNFGDGSPLLQTSYVTSPGHMYSASGVYNVLLTMVWTDATNNIICTDTESHAVTMTIVPPNNIYGNIFYDSLSNWGTANSWKVWLIQATTNNGVTFLSAVDSLALVTNYPSYNFSGKPAGSYIVKAALLNQTTGAAGFIPTYHDSSLYWNSAQTIVHPGTGYSYGNIWMKNGIVTSGPGFVAGNVSLGANKGAANGVVNIQVYLRNSAGAVIKSATTDANGDFSIAGVPVGIYSVYPENMNYTTTPVNSVYVTNGTSSVTGINFNQDNTQRSIKPRGLGVDKLGSSDVVFSIAPNPASKNVTIAWSGVDARGAHLIVSNLTGQVIINKAVSNASNETLDISGLQPGVYFLRGTEALSSMAQKLMIK